MENTIKLSTDEVEEYRGIFCVPLPYKIEARIKGEEYIFKNKFVVWDGISVRCRHDRRLPVCKDCGGNQICAHGRYKSSCKDCGGASICGHGRVKNDCKSCGGSSFCNHGKRKDRCKDCGGSQICVHKKRRALCKDCKSNNVCSHNRVKYYCKICSPENYLASLLRSRLQIALKKYTIKKEKHTLEYLGCTLGELRVHLEKQFKYGMTWENQGKWHIDHIRPCASFDLSKEEEIGKCFHYTNMQPLWALDNYQKYNKYDGVIE
jgi:hypothetical protein